MSLVVGVSRDVIYSELSESDYINTNDETWYGGNSLKNMYRYATGNTSGYSRSYFEGRGAPEMGSSLSLTPKDNALGCTFTLDDNGGFECTFVAQYWPTEGANIPTDPCNSVNDNFQQIGSGTSEQQYSFDLTGLSSNTTYQVTVTAFNKFNNYIASGYSNYPCPFQDNNSLIFSYTNIIEGTPDAPSAQIPGILVNPDGSYSSRPDTSFVFDIYLEISAGGDQDSIQADLRINGTDQSHSVSCSNGLGTNTPEMIIQSSLAFQTTDTVECRVKATGGGGDSDWSSWVTIPTGTTPSCPLGF